MSREKHVKPGEHIIMTERCKTMEKLLNVVERTAREGFQIAIYRDNTEWVVSFTSGPWNKAVIEFAEQEIIE